MLSKSQYTQYKHCSKHWWLSRREKEVLAPPSEALQTIFERGRFIGQVARDQFPGGVLVENVCQTRRRQSPPQELMGKAYTPFTKPHLSITGFSFWRIFWKKRRPVGT